MRSLLLVGLAVGLASGGCRKRFDPCDEPGGCVTDDVPVRPTDPVDTGLPDCAGPVRSCTSAIKPLLPQPNATGVFYRTPFVIEFTQDESQTASFRLLDAGGVDVPLSEPTWSTNGKQASFRALDALAPSSRHLLEIAYSCAGCDLPTLEFTTSATGEPVDLAEAIGGTYALDLATGSVVEPAGVNSLLGSLLGQLETTVALVPSSLDASGNLAFYGGVLDLDGAQDACTPTFDAPPAELVDEAYFELLAPDGLTLDFGGVPIELLDLELSGAFAPDAVAIEGLRLRGTLDTRTLIPVLGDTLGGATGDDAVCNLVGTFTNNAVQCRRCPDGGDLCLTLEVVDLTAPRIDADLARVTPEDVAEDPTCAGP